MLSEHSALLWPASAGSKKHISLEKVNSALTCYKWWSEEDEPQGFQYRISPVVGKCSRLFPGMREASTSGAL